MNAWEVLSAMDRNNDGFITPEEFGHQYVVSVGQGQAAFFGGGNGGVQPGGIKKTGKAAGPKWFQKMDTNGDGDISPREFLGPPELFRKMDLNGDGLIDAEEAWKANEWFVKKGQ